MVVERRENESGQSIVEFLLMVPLLVGMMITAVKVNTAAQVSIVNQQYARAQALFMTYNSPNYPVLSRVDRSFVGNSLNVNQLVVFVGEENAPDDSGENTTNPSAPTVPLTQDAARTRAPTGGRLGSPARTGKVRVLSSVSLCTQSHTVNSRGGIAPASRMSEDTDFRFCAYPLMETGGGAP
jgi:hypothetical protein